MATHIIRTDEPNIFRSTMDTGGSTLLADSVTSRKFVVFHDDGSYSIFRGSGLSIDWSGGDGGTTTGQVTSVHHYDQSGLLTDKIIGFDLPATQIVYALQHGFWLYGPHSGDDIIRSIPADSLLVINDEILSGLGNDTIYVGSGDDYADGSFGDDIIYGQDGNDTLRGDTDTIEFGTWLHGNDTLVGGAGDDTLYGGLGDDLIRGGSGDDTAIYDETFAELTIVRITAGFQVTTAGGVDILRGIEHIQTSDGTYGWDPVQQLWVPDVILA